MEAAIPAVLAVGGGWGVEPVSPTAHSVVTFTNLFHGENDGYFIH